MRIILSYICIEILTVGCWYGEEEGYHATMLDHFLDNRMVILTFVFFKNSLKPFKMPSEGNRFNVDHVLNNICIFILLYWQWQWREPRLTGQCLLCMMYGAMESWWNVVTGWYQDTPPELHPWSDNLSVISISSYLLTPPARLTGLPTLDTHK